MEENKKELVCYSKESVIKMIEALEHITVSGITSVTALASIVQLLNNAEKTIVE